MHPSAVFGPLGHTHKPLKKGGKKGYPTAHFMQISAKSKKKRGKKELWGNFQEK